MDCNLVSLGYHLGEGNGTPLQYSCLENPRDGGAWWAAVYGVAQSRNDWSDAAAAAAAGYQLGFRGLKKKIPILFLWQTSLRTTAIKIHKMLIKVAICASGGVGTGWMGATMGARLFNMVLIFKPCDYINYPEN